jgi:cytochrome b6-f complex iron-sulfur subunit
MITLLLIYLSMEKRDFIKKASAATILASMGITIDSCSPGSIPEPDPKPSSNDPVVIDITTDAFKDLQNDQGWAIDSDNKILLLNISDSFVAFDARCTHAGCFNDWNFNGSESKLTCQCHSSTFTTNGEVVTGPATEPLTKYDITREGDFLTINR